MKLTYTEHTISRIFYAFKSGYELYANLFAEAIVIALRRDPQLSKIKFDFIVNIPLSPDKQKAGELDRVDVVCKKLSVLLNRPYRKNMLILSKPISRRSYKSLGITSSEFLYDYFNFLKWNKKISLNNKKILVIDDVVTDGKTLEAFAKKIHSKYSKAQIYAATCGIMAKKSNMTYSTIKRYEWR